MSGHRCPGAGCTLRVSSSKLFCANHWRQTPIELRVPVSVTYARWKASRSNESLGFHRAAVKAAITWHRAPAGGGAP